MSGIERVLAAILLAGAVAGAALVPRLLVGPSGSPLVELAPPGFGSRTTVHAAGLPPLRRARPRPSATAPIEHEPRLAPASATAAAAPQQARATPATRVTPRTSSATGPAASQVSPPQPSRSARSSSRLGHRPERRHAVARPLPVRTLASVSSSRAGQAGDGLRLGRRKHRSAPGRAKHPGGGEPTRAVTTAASHPPADAQRRGGDHGQGNGRDTTSANMSGWQGSADSDPGRSGSHSPHGTSGGGSRHGNAGR